MKVNDQRLTQCFYLIRPNFEFCKIVKPIGLWVCNRLVWMIDHRCLSLLTMFTIWKMQSKAKRVLSIILERAIQIRPVKSSWSHWSSFWPPHLCTGFDFTLAYTHNTVAAVVNLNCVPFLKIVHFFQTPCWHKWELKRGRGRKGNIFSYLLCSHWSSIFNLF